MGGKPGGRAAQEPRAGLGAFVGVDLGVGESGVVVESMRRGEGGVDESVKGAPAHPRRLLRDVTDGVGMARTHRATVGDFVVAGHDGTCPTTD